MGDINLILSISQRETVATGYIDVGDGGRHHNEKSHQYYVFVTNILKLSTPYSRQHDDVSNSTVAEETTSMLVTDVGDSLW